MKKLLFKFLSLSCLAITGSAFAQTCQEMMLKVDNIPPTTRIKKREVVKTYFAYNAEDWKDDTPWYECGDPIKSGLGFVITYKCGNYAWSRDTQTSDFWLTDKDRNNWKISRPKLVSKDAKNCEKVDGEYKQRTLYLYKMNFEQYNIPILWRIDNSQFTKAIMPNF